MKELNGDYLDTSLTANKNNWYNSYWENKPVLSRTETFDYTKVIKKKYQDMINNSVWNIGANGYSNHNTPPYGIPLLTQYNAERGNTTYKNSLATTWTGKVGLIYASDYGFASTNEERRKDLRAGVTYPNGSYNYSNGLCKNNNWLAKNLIYWSLSPYSGSSTFVFNIDHAGSIITNGALLSYHVFPSVYLKSNIKIQSGNGTKTNPYKLS